LPGCKEVIVYTIQQSIQGVYFFLPGRCHPGSESVHALMLSLYYKDFHIERGI